MKKFTIGIVVAVIIAASVLLQIFFGPFLSAKISTLPFVRKFDLLRPAAPIVIHTSEEVRVSDTQDVVATFNKVKSKLSAVLLIDNGSTRVIASAINISGDGVFMTVKQPLISVPPEKLAVRLASGEVGRVERVAFDPATNVAAIKANIGNVPPAAFADSLSLGAGERVVLSSVSEVGPTFLASFIASPEEVRNLATADRVVRNFQIQQVSGLVPGHAIIDRDGEIVGMWDGGSVIPSSVLKNTTTNYFANGGNIVRATYGFIYTFVSENEGKLFGFPAGARLTATEDAPAVAIDSPADQAGLRAGDTIVQVAGNRLTQTNHLDQHLEKIKPGESVVLTVVRGADTMQITIIAGELK